MVVTIQKPDKINRATVVEFIESLGLNPHDVHRMTFTPNTLFVDLIERNEEGKAFRDPYNPDQLKERTMTISVEF